MSNTGNYFFVSYSHKDREKVYQILNDLGQAGINIWSDRDLHGGDDWQRVIQSALEGASGLIVFISSASMQSKWVRNEIAYIMSGGQVPVIPILLEHVDLPMSLQMIQYLDFTEGYERPLSRLISALREWQTDDKISTENLDLQPIIQSQYQEAKSEQIVEPKPESVFVVHGHDNDLLKEVKQYLDSIGVIPIVLSEEENEIQSTPQTLFDKFYKQQARARFAIVLISSDDYGSAVREYEQKMGSKKAGEQTLQFRGRQNVILELGFFYGRLGTENVFVLHKYLRDENGKPVYFPRFERPSDLAGILFDEVDVSGNWKNVLYERLRKADFNLK